jgi:hypothetical protein
MRHSDRHGDSIYYVHWTQTSVSQSYVPQRTRYSLVASDRAQAVNPDHTALNEGPNTMASSMPHLEPMFQSIQRSRCFAKIDLFHAYWQLALAVES